MSSTHRLDFLGTTVQEATLGDDPIEIPSFLANEKTITEVNTLVSP